MIQTSVVDIMNMNLLRQMWLSKDGWWDRGQVWVVANDPGQRSPPNLFQLIWNRFYIRDNFLTSCFFWVKPKALLGKAESFTLSKGILPLISLISLFFVYFRNNCFSKVSKVTKLPMDGQFKITVYSSLNNLTYISLDQFHKIL